MIAEENIKIIIEEFSSLPSLDSFYYSAFSMVEERRYKILGTEFNFRLKFYYDAESRKYYYKLFLEDINGRHVSIEEAFDSFPIDIKDWVIYNLDLFRKRNEQNNYLEI
jgi:hypothetical protein